MPTLKYRDPADGQFKPLIGGSSGGGGEGTTVDGLPLGAILPYPSATPPTDWLLCDGSAIPAQYTDLIALIGANTPNLLGKFVAGAGAGSYTVGATGGADTHRHSHVDPVAISAGNQYITAPFSNMRTIDTTTTHYQAIGGFDYVVTGGAMTGPVTLEQHIIDSTLVDGKPPFVALTYIIKAKLADVVASPGDYATKQYVDAHIITGVSEVTSDVASGWANIPGIPAEYRLISAQTVIVASGTQNIVLSFHPDWAHGLFGIPGGVPHTVRWVAMLGA